MSNLTLPQKTMSSVEIAELTGKRHDHVMRDIRNTLNELKIGLPKFGATYRNKQNKEQPCFELPKRECLILVSGYSVELRAKIIDRWQELENGAGHALPKTYLQALEALVESEKQKAAALAIAEEKRIQLDESKQWYTIKRVAFANGLNWKELEWRKLKNAGDKPCKKVFDANFPLGVNAYHQSAWEEVYPELDLPDTDYSEDTALMLGVVR